MYQSNTQTSLVRYPKLTKYITGEFEENTKTNYPEYAAQFVDKVYFYQLMNKSQFLEFTSLFYLLNLNLL